MNKKPTSCSTCNTKNFLSEETSKIAPHLGTDGEDLHGLGQGVGQGADDEQPVQEVRRHPVRRQLVGAPHLVSQIGIWVVVCQCHSRVAPA